MLRRMLEISLVCLLTAGGDLSGEPDRTADRTAELDRLAERVRTGRAAREFAEELALFDSQLYGRLGDESRQRSQMAALQEDIRSTSSHLNQMKNMIPGDREFSSDELVNLPVDQREAAVEVIRLEVELSSLQSGMARLRNMTLVPAATELLQADIWQGLLERAGERELLQMIDSLQRREAARIE